MAGPLTLLVAATIVLAVWIARHAILSSLTRSQTTVRVDTPAALPDDPPLVTILVPAKDEEANIGDCLRTLQAQDYSDFEIIVIDDRSTDRTAEIVREIAAEDSRVQLMQVSQLPEGWFGKSHAMHVGVGSARGQWLLFVDADCRQSPLSLRNSLAYTLDQGGDMLSLWPLLEMRTFGENLVQPLCGSILGLWFRPQRVNNPEDKAAFANGQYVLIRRATYDAVGGHAAIRHLLMEDINFARLVKGKGHRLLNAIGFDVFSTRMYDSLWSTWRGWARIFCGAFLSAWTLVVAIALVLLLSASPFVLTATAGALAWQAGWADPWLNALAAVGAAQLVVMSTVLVRYVRIIRARAGYLMFYPLTVLIVLGILVNALLMRLGVIRVRWRGTTYAGVDQA
jgi:glycosyltransferase involved in cell wall biosynthesis